MSTRRGMTLRVALAALFASPVAGWGRAVMNHLANSAPPPSFGQRYGNNPKSHNGGNRTCAAAAKRAARKRRNIAKHRRSAA